MKNDHRSKFSNLSNWKEEAWKNQGFNGIRTRDLRDSGAMLYQLSYEAAHWERGQFIEFISPVRSEMMWSIYEIIHIFEQPQFKYWIITDNKWNITGAMLYQLSYEAAQWEPGQFIEFISPVRSEMMWSIYEIIHIFEQHSSNSSSVRVKVLRAPHTATLYPLSVRNSPNHLGLLQYTLKTKN